MSYFGLLVSAEFDIDPSIMFGSIAWFLLCFPILHIATLIQDKIKTVNKYEDDMNIMETLLLPMPAFHFHSGSCCFMAQYITETYWSEIIKGNVCSSWIKSRCLLSFRHDTILPIQKIMSLRIDYRFNDHDYHYHHHHHWQHHHYSSTNLYMS